MKDEPPAPAETLEAQQPPAPAETLEAQQPPAPAETLEAQQSPAVARRRPTIDEDRLRAILRGSVPRTAAPNLLGGVQRRIRERSRGRFYGDGWSRSRQATSTYVVTSLLALGIFLLAYFVLLPSLPLK